MDSNDTPRPFTDYSYMLGLVREPWGELDLGIVREPPPIARNNLPMFAEQWETLLGNPDVHLDGEGPAVEAIRAWVGIPAAVLPADRFLYLDPPQPST